MSLREEYDIEMPVWRRSLRLAGGSRGTSSTTGYQERWAQRRATARSLDHGARRLD